MARHIKVGLNSGKKQGRSGLTGKILSHLSAHTGLGARILTSMVMLSANSVPVPATLGVRVEHQNVVPEDALSKRMQILR